MSTRHAASHVVDRCPRCGLEHDHRVHECEACHSAVRSWCRRHGRDAGWLDGPDCPRCAEEAVRPLAPAPPALPLDSLAATPAITPPVKAAGPDDEPLGCIGNGIVAVFGLALSTFYGAVLGAVVAIVYVMVNEGGNEVARLIIAGGVVLGLLYGVLVLVMHFREENAKRRAAPPGTEGG